MHGGSEAAREGKTGAAELAGVANRGCGGGVLRGEEDGRPQGGDWVQESEMLIGASIGGLGQPSGRETGGEGRRRRPCFPAEG